MVEIGSRDFWDGSDIFDPGSRDSYDLLVAGTVQFTGWIGFEDGLIHAIEVNGTIRPPVNLWRVRTGIASSFTTLTSSGRCRPCHKAWR